LQSSKIGANNEGRSVVQTVVPGRVAAAFISPICAPLLAIASGSVLVGASQSRAGEFYDHQIDHLFVAAADFPEIGA
jgi:hypothetical protein